MIEKIFETLRVHFHDSPLTTGLICLLLLALSYVAANEFVRSTRILPGFRGPWQNYIPLVGVIPSIRVNAAETYKTWSKKYGDVYQIMIGNNVVLVVNSAAAAREIFGGHSQALSSRPVFYTFHKVLSNTAGTTIGTSPYSDSLKRRRKGAASALNKPSVQTYLGHLDVETRDFIIEALRYGKEGKQGVDPMHIVQRLSLSLALTLNWGTRITQDDKLFDEITEVEEEISRFRSTTGNLQDYIPILRLNPINRSSTKAREMRDRRDKYLNKLNDDLDDRIAKGTHAPCIQANIILDKEASLNKEELTSISLTMLSGGLDTLTTLMQWSIALLATRPDIQARALEAIREFYSAGQPLCDPLDDQKCTYVVALVRECLRYYTVLRLALPRATVKSFEYKGAKVPAGSTIFLNAWACNTDSAIWGPDAPIPTSDPMIFDPERWLINPDNQLATYGLGYRMCAGSLLANRELYLVFMRMLSAFEIVEDSFVDVHPVRGSADPTSLVTVPRRYTVFFKPRDVQKLKHALAYAETEK